MKNSLMKAAFLVVCAVCSITAEAQTVNLQLQSDYTVGTASNTPRFAVGDVNNDRLPDLVTLNPGNLSAVGPISVFLNNGAGGYGSALNTPNVSLSPTDAVIRDFNGDGNADLAISQTGIADAVNIRLGNGTGNFLTGTSIAAERGSPSIVSADFNGDNIHDLATCNNINQLRVLNGNGTGGFAAAMSFATAAVCQDLVVADFNVDGRPDLAVAMRLAPRDRNVQIFLNNGTSFDTPISVIAIDATELVVADFNRDCIPDLAAAQFASTINTPIFILLGNGAGGFTSTTLTLNNQPRYMTIGDFNRDKKVDLAIRHNVNNQPTANTLTILPGNGAGAFGAPFQASIANATSSTEMFLATTDANLDGRDDLIIGRQGGFLLYHGNSALFTRTENDFDGDLKTDIGVFRPSGGNWYIRQSTRGLSSAQWGLGTDKPTPADFDGDGKTDIAVWREAAALGQDSIFYILQSSNNTVKVERFGQTGDNPLVVGDWDGDGKADAAVYRSGATAGAQSYFFYRPSTSPAPNSVVVNPWGTAGDAPVRGDFDGDGRQDAAVFRPSSGFWSVLQSSNNQAVYQNWGLASDRRVPADYDGDGKTDFAVFRPSNSFWYVLNSATNTAAYRQWGGSTDTLTPGDYNGDGKTEPTVYRSSGQTWYIPPCASFNQFSTQFGASGDVALPSVYFP